MNSTKTLRHFGLTMAAAHCVLALVITHKSGSTPWILPALSLGYLIIGLTIPAVLGPVYRVWMRGARVLGFINTRILLAVLFYVILTPVGLIMRLLGNDPLTRKLRKDQDSYWIEKPPRDTDRERYRRQF